MTCIYDEDGNCLTRTITRTKEDGTLETITEPYDANGNQTTKINGSETTVFTYDDHQQLLSVCRRRTRSKNPMALLSYLEVGVLLSKSVTTAQNILG